MKTFFKIFLYSFATYIIFSPIRSVSFRWATVAGSILYVLLTLWMLKKYSNQKRRMIYGAIFTGMAFIELPLRIVDFAGTEISFIYCLCILWAFITTILAYEYKNKILIIIGCLIWLLGITKVADRWAEIYNYGKLNKEQTLNVADYSIEDSNKKFKLKELKGKYIVLYFWGSHCSSCFKSFPNLQKMHEKYKNDSTIIIASVFLKNDRKDEDIKTGQKLITDRGHDFTVFATDYENPLLDCIEFHVVPTILILDEYHNVIFRGSLNFARTKLEELLHD
ncbi:TlpA family protein disulfide reductase [Phocaeicola sartorii]|uniref:Thioredoxin-like fold domain-containing protein n=1 Tax=Phocaeicola sartorii TaxID=671267 RepID=R9ICG6_9BACT|nr:TlpA disulfide reductase family protein [Phocaeicola sartorii]EOS15034.1 hypothetical protein C802_01051 [Phocaeicola sartorii]NUL01179.1 TlpA family protein disulfide reductase [Phocaeicola sartorii]